MTASNREIPQKFIILKDGTFKMGRVWLHKELHSKKEEIVGGGWWQIYPGGKGLHLFDKSEDFGPVTEEQIRNADYWTIEDGALTGYPVFFSPGASALNENRYFHMGEPWCKKILVLGEPREYKPPTNDKELFFAIAQIFSLQSGLYANTFNFMGIQKLEDITNLIGQIEPECQGMSKLSVLGSNLVTDADDWYNTNNYDVEGYEKLPGIPIIKAIDKYVHPADK